MYVSVAVTAYEAHDLLLLLFADVKALGWTDDVSTRCGSYDIVHERHTPISIALLAQASSSMRAGLFLSRRGRCSMQTIQTRKHNVQLR